MQSFELISTAHKSAHTNLRWTDEAKLQILEVQIFDVNKHLTETLKLRWIDEAKLWSLEIHLKSAWPKEYAMRMLQVIHYRQLEYCSVNINTHLGLHVFTNLIHQGFWTKYFETKEQKIRCSRKEQRKVFSYWSL